VEPLPETELAPTRVPVPVPETEEIVAEALVPVLSMSNEAVPE